MEKNVLMPFQKGIETAKAVPSAKIESHSKICDPHPHAHQNDDSLYFIMVVNPKIED